MQPVLYYLEITFEHLEEQTKVRLLLLFTNLLLMTYCYEDRISCVEKGARCVRNTPAASCHLMNYYLGLVLQCGRFQSLSSFSVINSACLEIVCVCMNRNLLLGSSRARKYILRHSNIALSFILSSHTIRLIIEKTVLL